MIFSTRSTYGLRAIINLAKREKFGSVSLAVIAKQENISLKYLERLFANLKKTGLIKAEIGANGGYLLAKSAKQINVYDIIKALEGKLLTSCLTTSRFWRAESEYSPLGSNVRVRSRYSRASLKSNF